MQPLFHFHSAQASVRRSWDTQPMSQDIRSNLEWLKSPSLSSNETFEDKKEGALSFLSSKVSLEASMRVSEHSTLSLATNKDLFHLGFGVSSSTNISPVVLCQLAGRLCLFSTSFKRETMPT